MEKEDTSWNPLRFSSLLGRPNQSLALPLLRNSLLVHVFLFSHSVLAAQQNPAAEAARQAETCQRRPSDEINIYRDASHLRDEWNAEKQCHYVDSDEFLNHNSRFNLEAILRDRGALANNQPSVITTYLDQETARKKGACKLTYEAVKETYDAFQNIRRQYCLEYQSSQAKARECGENKECLQKWRELKTMAGSYYQFFLKHGNLSADYLQSLAVTNAEVRTHFERDRDELGQEIQETKATAALRSAQQSARNEELKASNGGKKTIEEYLTALTGPSLHWSKVSSSFEKLTRLKGPLIQEQEKAEARAQQFKERIRAMAYREAGVIQSVSNQLEGIINRIEKNASVATPNPLTNPSTITNFAGLGSQALQQTAGSTSPTISALSGGSSLPAITALAAAGAAGAMAGTSLGKSLGGDSSQNTSGALPPSVSPPAAGPLAGTTFTTGSEAVPESDRKPATIPEELPTAAENGKPASEPGIFQNSQQAGSSRPLNGKPAASGKVDPSTSPNMADNGGKKSSEELLGNFNLALDPKAVSKHSSGTGEVASLLGQMKNLFNFDEGATPFSGGGAPGLAPNAVGGGDYSAEAQTGLEETADSSTVPEAPSGEEYAQDSRSSYQAEKRQASSFGSLDISLFQRVRFRHHQYMEKGLVLYGLKGRVE